MYANAWKRTVSGATVFPPVDSGKNFCLVRQAEVTLDLEQREAALDAGEPPRRAFGVGGVRV